MFDYVLVFEEVVVNKLKFGFLKSLYFSGGIFFKIGKVILGFLFYLYVFYLFMVLF